MRRDILTCTRFRIYRLSRHVRVWLRVDMSRLCFLGSIIIIPSPMKESVCIQICCTDCFFLLLPFDCRFEFTCINSFAWILLLGKWLLCMFLAATNLQSISVNTCTFQLNWSPWHTARHPDHKENPKADSGDGTMVVRIDLLDEKAEKSTGDGMMVENDRDLVVDLEGAVLLPSRLHGIEWMKDVILRWWWDALFAVVVGDSEICLWIW